MCDRFCLGAERALPQIIENESEPGLWIEKLQTDFFMRDYFPDGFHLYSVGSFMGCSCGLALNSSLKEMDAGEYKQRLQDLSALKRYLAEQSESQTILLLRLDLEAVGWVEPPLDEEVFNFAAIDLYGDDFEFPENKLLRISSFSD